MTKPGYGAQIIRLAMIALLGMGALFVASTARAQTDEEAIEARVGEIVAAFNDGDIDTLAAFFTDEGLIAFVDDPTADTVDEALASLEEFIGTITVEIGAVRDIAIADETASAVVELSFEGGAFQTIDRLHFELVDDDWIVTDYEVGVEAPPPTEIPNGFETIPVDLDEYQFIVDTSGIAIGDQIAFQAENIGEEEHELVFLKVPEDLDLEEALGAEEPPEGIEDIAFTFVMPGQTGVALVENPLEAGRYAFVCFVPSPEGVPHALLGMVEEFTLQAPATPTPTATATPTESPTASPTAAPATPTREAPAPPDTGSGIAGSDSNNGLLIFGAVIAAVVLGGGFAARTLVKR